MDANGTDPLNAALQLRHACTVLTVVPGSRSEWFAGTAVGNLNSGEKNEWLNWFSPATTKEVLCGKKKKET